jgi:2-dehydropantoate 2-reductase
VEFVVYGAGAVGGVVGSLLYRAGSSVSLIARGQHLAVIQSVGLRLVTPSVDVTQRIPAVASPHEIAWTGGEVVLVAVKSDATADIGPALSRAAPAGTRVVSLQNGVSNEPTLARWFEHVYGITVMAPTTHLEPGVVHAKSAGAPAVLDIGRWPTGLDVTCVSVAAAFRRAGIVSEPRPDIMAWKHRKLVLNLGNVVDAFCVPNAAADSLTDALRTEAEEVLDAAGIAVTPASVDLERRGDLLRRGPSVGPTGSSTWQSLERGTGSVETDHLNGEIVRLGKECGVATPLNARVVALAHRMLESGAEPRSVDATTLLPE